MHVCVYLQQNKKKAKAESKKKEVQSPFLFLQFFRKIPMNIHVKCVFAFILLTSLATVLGFALSIGIFLTGV